jgi:hypothetical protein
MISQTEPHHPIRVTPWHQIIYYLFVFVNVLLISQNRSAAAQRAASTLRCI